MKFISLSTLAIENTIGIRIYPKARLSSQFLSSRVSTLSRTRRRRSRVVVAVALSPTPSLLQVPSISPNPFSAAPVWA
ncbi:hypothetical protein LINPERHAP2_LOCUS15238 [Linum perenne]